MGDPNSYSAKYYRNNKEKYSYQARKARRKLIVQRNQAFIRDYLMEHPCVDCGENDIIVLEFDHIKPKTVKWMDKLSGNTYSIERIKQEIALCEVVCANCHRRRTCKRHGGWHRSQTAQ